MAEDEHVAFFRQGDRLFLSNTAQRLHLALRQDDGEGLSSDRWRIDDTLELRIGHSRLTFEHVNTSGFGFTLSVNGANPRSYSFDATAGVLDGGHGATSWPDCQSQPDAKTRFFAWAQSQLLSDERSLIWIGGRVSCAYALLPLGRTIYHLAHAQWAWRSVAITRGKDGAFWLRAGDDLPLSSEAVQVSDRSLQKAVDSVDPSTGERMLTGIRGDLRDAWWPIVFPGRRAVREIIVGHTQYRLLWQPRDSRITLIPDFQFAMLPRALLGPDSKHPLGENGLFCLSDARCYQPLSMCFPECAAETRVGSG